MDKIEILAPCGSFDSVVSAVRCKADAVYIGAKDFSARSSAQNFDIDEMDKAVRYCHNRNVSVYLALNTLVFDDELSKALELVESAAECDIDAIIVQDIGLALAIKRAIPDIRLHASTQMSVHSLSGAKALYELGFNRVVLARELSRQEIKKISDNCPIELEVFVHGALCMSVSGQCYMSAMLGTRSANRGKCAQPCRLPFMTIGCNHALSLKDNSIISYLNELSALGVKSAKIEGRMKRPEYVAAATSACVKMRDLNMLDEDTSRRLSSVFSRTGFTDGYYTANRNKDMFGYRKKDDVTSADEKLLKEIRNTYKDETQRVEVSFDIKIKQDETVKLTVTDENRTVTVESAFKAQTAVNNPLSEEKVIAQLSKTGNTPFKVKSVTCSVDEKAFASAKDINELRRTALSELSAKRERLHNYKINDINIEDIIDKEAKNCNNDEAKSPTLRARVNDLNIPLSFNDMELVFAPLFLMEKNIEKVKSLIKSGINLGTEIPRGMFSLDEKIETALKKLKEIGIKDVLCNNIGAVYIAKKLGFIVYGSAFLNVTNSLSLKFMKDYGVRDTELSLELDANRIKNLKSVLNTGVISYGYIPLMLCRNCPVKSGGADCKSCKKDVKLQDRKGEKFLVSCDGFVSEILNCVPLILPEKIYNEKTVNFTTLRFSVENSVENKEKIREILSKNQKTERFTHGLYLRGVK